MDPSNPTPDSAANMMDLNGDGSSSSSTTAKDVEASSNSQHPQPKTYDDLFPSLPASGKGPGAKGSGNPIGEWNRKPILHQSSTVTQVLNIPMAERRNGLTSFGGDESHKSLKYVMDKTGAKIEMSSSKDQSLTFLITGKQDAVLNGRKELLAHFQTQQSTTISIPKEHHRYILGRGGTKLQDLEQRTATKISMPKVTEATDKITLIGPKDGIEKALHEIHLVSDQQSKQAYEVLPIAKMYHPFVNGPNGENVRKLMADYPNVRINMPPLSVIKDEIVVAGEKEAVIKIVGIINKVAKEMERKCTTVSVEVKKSQHKYVIGPKGNAINEILADTGVFVEMPSTESPSETITLRGPQEKLGFALTKVYEKANSVVSYEVSCPNWLHKYIIGRKGASIQKLTCDLPKVHVEFVDCSSSIKIEGPPDEADKARDLLEAQAEELIRTTEFTEIAVDAKYHKHIIGKGGSTVNRLKQERDVTINIPDVDRGVANIRIEGNKEGVRMAKMELEELVHKMQNEKEKDMIIESRFHRQLIGPKGESIQKIREDFSSVQISFPDLGVQSEVVKLRGPRQDVDKCSQVLNKMYKELLESNFQMEVPIFKQFHKFIVGRGGVTIKKIRQETDTRIDLPEPGSDSDMIVITGKKANVEKAQEMIQQIQAEKANVVSVDIQIPAKIHNTIIGAGGKLIQSIMDDCGGVHIKFPEAKSGSDKVSIRGPKEDVEKAKEMLLSLSSDRQLNNSVAEVRAKQELHKFLIGRQGVNIQVVRDKTGARIIFPNEKDKDREVITIIGTKEAVAMAKEELETRIKDLDNVVEDTMVVDQKHHRYFVTRRGEVLRGIGEEFGGVIISFPRSGVDSDKVTLKGAKDCVAGARARMEELVADLECQVTIECVIEQQHHRTVMGPRGSNVQKICQEYGVQIKIPDRRPTGNDEVAQVNENGNQQCDVIRIGGKQENCDGAAEALKLLIPINVEVAVPFDYHRFIIGLNGAGVKKLMNEHDVSIKVPNSEEQSSVVVVTGPPANVASAKTALAERVEEIKAKMLDDELRSFEIKIEVDPQYHPKIIGRKGARITQLRELHGVNIKLPKKDDPEPSTITITGYEANTTAAKEAIMEIVKEYEAMTKEVLKIDHRVHSMIIGRRGAEIKRIMLEFKVDVRLPREGDPDPDCVTLMGSEDGVLDCKDHLLNLEEEYLQEAIDRENLKAYKMAPLKQMQQAQEKAAAAAANSTGFEVAKGAPWQGTDNESFPSLGGGAASGVISTPVWGPRR